MPREPCRRRSPVRAREARLPHPVPCTEKKTLRYQLRRRRRLRARGPGHVPKVRTGDSRGKPPSVKAGSAPQTVQSGRAAWAVTLAANRGHAPGPSPTTPHSLPRSGTGMCGWLRADGRPRGAWIRNGVVKRRTGICAPNMVIQRSPLVVLRVVLDQRAYQVARRVGVLRRAARVLKPHALRHTGGFMCSVCRRCMGGLGVVPVVVLVCRLDVVLQVLVGGGVASLAAWTCWWRSIRRK